MKQFDFKIKDYNPKHLWFTSDPHFGHANIIRFCSRPFHDVGHQDSQLIKNWNELIGADDFVFMLGDLGICNAQHAFNCATQLNGRKYWILGNHDVTNSQMIEKCSPLFERVELGMEIRVKDQILVLSHYPILSWARKNHGSWHLFGHAHGNMQKDELNRKIVARNLMMDVGVDCCNYKPISFNEVSKVMNNKIKLNANPDTTFD